MTDPRMTPTNDAPVTVELPAVCDGKEQHAFEEWAKGQRFDMTEHPLHYLFLNERTDAARDGWKAGLAYASRLAALASAPAGDGRCEHESWTVDSAGQRIACVDCGHAFADAGKPIAPAGDGVVAEVVELARRDIAREQTDFLGRMGQALCTYQGIFDEYPDGDLPEDVQEEADEQISALAGLALAQLILLRHPCDGTDPAAALARPRAAVGERESILEQAAQEAYRVCAETRHVSLGDKARDAILALQSPPAKVEGV